MAQLCLSDGGYELPEMDSAASPRAFGAMVRSATPSHHRIHSECVEGKMSKRTETRWVIVGNAGLYIGQWQLRKDAIKDHVAAYYQEWPNTPPDEWIAEKWRQCRKSGDRVVKATITWTEP